MHIAVITHAQDRLLRPGASGKAVSDYMLGPVLQQAAAMGHKITVCRGFPPKRVEADLAIMHVDLTAVPRDYLELARSFPSCVNLQAADISKRSIGGARLVEGDAWQGPVIVKSDFNYRAIPELRLNAAAKAAGRPLPYPGLHDRYDYSIYPSPGAVPSAVKADPTLVVERFLPERAEGGYALRFWTFSGAAERCSRVFSEEPVVKSDNQTGFEFVEVPDRLREIRTALGFDYGKFDFVIHDGEPVLLDANRTPGAPPVPKGAAWPKDYAEGLIALAR